jgi:hypothetical protein
MFGEEVLGMLGTIVIILATIVLGFPLVCVFFAALKESVMDRNIPSIVLLIITLLAVLFKLSQ